MRRTACTSQRAHETHGCSRPRDLSEQRGSILLATLVICFGLSATALALATVADLSRLLVEEDARGRQALARADEGLASVLLAATEQPGVRALEVPGLAYARIEESPRAAPFSLGVLAGVPVEGGILEVRARLERAADGIDLPDRVLVAANASVAEGHTFAEVVMGGGEAPARVSLRSPSPFPPSSSSVEVDFGRAWALDQWQLLVLKQAAGLSSSRVVLAEVDRAGKPALGAGQGTAPERPVLLVGGQDVPLDLTGFGDLYGVALAGDLGVRLEGTTLHGGVFTSGEVRFGEGARLVDSPGVRRWASTASLPVARLVPGTRQEVVVGEGG